MVHEEGRSHTSLGAKQARWLQRGLHHLVVGGVSLTSPGSPSTPFFPHGKSTALTGPAGPDHEGRLRPRRVDEAVVVDQGRVVGDAIHVQRHCGELQVEGIVVPLVIADLRQTAEHGFGKGQKEKGHGEDANPSSPAQASRGISQALRFPATASRGKKSGSHAQPESSVSSHPLPGASTGIMCHSPSSPTSQNQKPTLPCMTGTQHRVLKGALQGKGTPKEAVFLSRNPCPSPALEHQRFAPAGTIPSKELRGSGQKCHHLRRSLTAPHCTADHGLLFPPAFAGHHGMLHPQGEGEVVTQPLVAIWAVHHRYLGSLAAIEPVDEAAVLAVMHREPRRPVCCGARHWQQVNLS